VAGVTGAPQPDLRLIRSFQDLCQFGKEWFDIMPRMARFPAKSRRARRCGMALGAEDLIDAAFRLDLACRRGGRDVFAGVSFAVGPGRGFDHQRPQRRGKILAAAHHRRAGAHRRRPARAGGGDPELSIAEQAHYLGHQDALKPSLSVAENLRFWAGFFGARAAISRKPLAAVGLDALADLPAAYLSAGQRRRLSIARLLAVKRPIWLLDEPTSTLDAAAQERLADLMRAHLAGGGLILAATHGPIGLDNAQELRLDQASTSPPIPN
jgi:heme exporter protein A